MKKLIQKLIRSCTLCCMFFAIVFGLNACCTSGGCAPDCGYSYVNMGNCTSSCSTCVSNCRTCGYSSTYSDWY